jgi:Fur family peroxide stress response transcriptional regulator
VYNTLELLEEMGFVRRIDGLEGCAHFDPDTSRHRHAICVKCRQVWDVDPVELPDNLPDGFAVTGVLIQGTCSGCAAENSAPATTDCYEKGEQIQSEVAM